MFYASHRAWQRKAKGWEKVSLTILPPQFASSLASQTQAAPNKNRNKSPILPSMIPGTSTSKTNVKFLQKTKKTEANKI